MAIVGTKHFSIGDSGFYGIVRDGKKIVDKSLFIKEFINTDYIAHLALYPPRFCKTTNLRMMESFFDIEKKKKTNHYLQIF